MAEVGAVRSRALLGVVGTLALIVTACAGADGPTGDDLGAGASPTPAAKAAEEPPPDPTAAPEPTSAPEPTPTSPGADEAAGGAVGCDEDAMLEAVQAALATQGIPEHAFEHASFEDFLCADDFGSVRVERLSDPGYRVVLAHAQEGWSALLPLAPACQDHARYDVPADVWYDLVPSAATDSERGWVDCLPSGGPVAGEPVADQPGLTPTADGIGVADFGAGAQETLDAVAAHLGIPTFDSTFTNECGPFRTVRFDSDASAGLALWFTVDPGGEERFERYELGVQGFDPARGLPPLPPGLEDVATPEGIGYGSSMAEAESVYPHLEHAGHVVQSMDSLWETGTGLRLRETDGVVALLAATREFC